MQEYVFSPASEQAEALLDAYEQALEAGDFTLANELLDRFCAVVEQDE